MQEYWHPAAVFLVLEASVGRTPSELVLQALDTRALGVVPIYATSRAAKRRHDSRLATDQAECDKSEAILRSQKAQLKLSVLTHSVNIFRAVAFQQTEARAWKRKLCDKLPESKVLLALVAPWRQVLVGSCGR